MSNNLEYDDSAFVYFSLSVLVTFVVPGTFVFVRSTLRKAFYGEQTSKLKDARTSAEKQKVESLSSNRSKLSSMLSCGFFLKLVLLMLAWYAIFSIFSSIGEHTQIQRFDPFEILGLPDTATMAEIKKAYRKLSIQWHPDKFVKQPADEQKKAELMFMKISKAHEALTDEVAMENFRKFGNPDGRQAMEVSIGLPPWLLMRENHNLVLVIYLVVLVIMVPIFVAMYYSNSKQYGDKMILNDTYQVYMYLMPTVVMKHMPEMLALSAEYRKFSIRAEDIDKLDRVKRLMISEERMVKRSSHNTGNLFKRWPNTEKVWILLHAHLNRYANEEYLTPALVEDTKMILRKAPMLLDAMMEVAKARQNIRWIHRVIELQQHLVQAVWFKDSPLLQLPHFGHAEVKHSSSGKGGIKSIEQFVHTKPQERLGMRRKGMANFTDTQCEDVEQMLQLLPDITFDVSIGVMRFEEDDGKIVFEEQSEVGDIVTVFVELTRNNVPDGESKPRIAHAPYFPIDIHEEWYLTMCLHDQEQLVNITKVTETDRVSRHKLMFPTNRLQPGTYSFDVHLTSTCYIGLDKKQTVSISLLPPGTLEVAEIHPDDANIEKDPTLFDDLFGPELGGEGENSDFEESEDEDEDGANKDGKKPTKSKPDNDDSDDTDDVQDLVYDDDEDNASNQQSKASSKPEVKSEDSEALTSPELTRLETELEKASSDEAKTRIKQQIEAEEKRLRDAFLEQQKEEGK